MVGVTLVDLRKRLDALVTSDGDFGLVCARTGERPFPASGKRFADRATAAAAARVTEHYRAALRRYDPRLPAHDVIVREETGPLQEQVDGPSSGGGDRAWALTDPVVTGGGPVAPADDLVEFCHGIAGAVFKTLSARGYDAVESAIMDGYVDLAEAVGDPDRLCLCLLESIATEFQAGLGPASQAAVCAGAAERLPAAAETEAPVRATFDRLRRLGIVGEYQRLPASIDLGTGERAVTVTVDEYALAPQSGRLPVLPIVVDLYRRRPRWPPTTVGARLADEGWRMQIQLGQEGDRGPSTAVLIDGN